MDTIIVVGIISAVVSVLSLLGNIYVARQNIKSSERRIGLETFLSIQREQYQTFNDFEKQAELLRIRCWGLKWWADNYSRRDHNFSVSVYNESVKSLLLQGESFRVGWASIKAELPRDIEGYTREIWHACNNKMGAVDIISRNLVFEIDKQNSKRPQGEFHLETTKKIDDDFVNVSDVLTSLLANLDELINISKSVRHTSESKYHLKKT